MFSPETVTREAYRQTPIRKSYRSRCMIVLVAGVFVAYTLWQYFQHELYTVQATTLLPVKEFVIEEGMSARGIAKHLAQQRIISSELTFYIAILMYFDPSGIKAGMYRLGDTVSMYGIAEQITSGDVVHDLVTLTHIEGERVSLLASRTAKLLPNFDSKEFLALASTSEGMLYPDTYYVDIDFTATDVFTILSSTYTNKIASLKSEMEAHPLTEKEIIILASIVEREANTEESMKMVAGILQNRLKIGMALQADASIEYVLDKSLQELTPEDLKLDTPYNTYLYPGLPPTPIGNPGLVAIKAVLEPTPSNYFFYITGTDGKFYYAKNFDEHRINIARHLR